MRLRLQGPALQQVTEAVFAGPTPAPRDLIAAYLFLPAYGEHPTRGRMKFRSSLEALLADAHGATGRDDEGNVVHAERLASWLGAMGYLALIDQIGKAVVWTDRPQPGQTPFERILLQHGSSPQDAATLYALRNAMVHSYGLANENRSRPELQHFFTLDVWGGHPLAKYPAEQWDGDPETAGRHATTVSLQAVGNRAIELVLHLQETWVRDQAIGLAPGVTPEQMRRRYFFQHPDPIVPG